MNALYRFLVTVPMFVGAVGLAHAAGAAKTVDIVANDSLRYNVTEIDAAPGQLVHVVFHNRGTLPKEVMGHNWVLLAQDENPDAYLAAAMTAKDDGYQPHALKAKVVASLPLLGPNETAELTFAAPETPGRYTYLCTFPAHCAAGMRGVLVVR
jgi:azurin